MPEQRPPEFGKRRPVAPPAATAPVKRSGHVALLLMGTLAVGGGAYALMPRGSCEPAAAGLTAAPEPQQGTACATRGSTSGGSIGSSRYGFFGDSSSRASSAATITPNSDGVTRGGFGSVARAFGFSGRG